jgi:hypothetical protein
MPALAPVIAGAILLLVDQGRTASAALRICRLTINSRTFGSSALQEST